jgi:hypothetical protein
MQTLLTSFHLSLLNWILLGGSALLIGMAKTGLPGVSMITIPIAAAIFGGRDSSGIMLPLLITGDIFAVIYYNRHAQWKYVIRLLPWAIVGIGLGVFVGAHISDLQFRQLMSTTILLGLVIMIYRETRGSEIMIPDTWWIAALLGLAGGFTTMVGNAAGPVMALYLLSMRLPKNSYIGTGAWFFFIVNLLKVPLHIIFWHTITIETVALDLTMVPIIIGGAFLGVAIVKKIRDKPYRILVIVATAIAAIRLFF